MTAPVLALPGNLAPLGLTRDEKHVYGWSDGTNVYHPIPSVTTAIRLIDKSGPLVGWAKRETAASAVRNLDALMAMRKEGGADAAINWLKQIPDYQRNQAADRGTSVHQIAEQIIRGQSPEIPEELGPYVAAYHGFIREWSPKWIAVEQMVCSLKHGYAGTFDAIAYIGNERWLLDIKTGAGVYAETALQLAAYGAAEFIGRPGDARKYRVPRATRFGVIHVVPEGAELVPYAVDKGDFAVFLKALEVWHWTQGKARTVVGKPPHQGDGSSMKVIITIEVPENAEVSVGTPVNGAPAYVPPFADELVPLPDGAIALPGDPVQPVAFRGAAMQNPDICPVHLVAWKTVPAGISKKTGKEYGAFKACPTQGCDQRPR